MDVTFWKVLGEPDEFIVTLLILFVSSLTLNWARCEIIVGIKSPNVKLDKTTSTTL